MPRWNKANVSNLVIRNSISGAGWDQGIVNRPGASYYVDRNVDASGDGSSWSKAFLTITEAITAVNADYTNSVDPGGGRNRTIFIGEGWYSEVGMTLTASDVHILGVASGSGFTDGVVLYGSENAAGWDDEALVPALTVSGWSNTIENVGFFNYANGLYPCISVGTSTPAATASHPGNNAFINCSFPRDVADKYTYAIEDYQQEGALYLGNRFSQSAKTGGIYFGNQNPTNPVGPVIMDNTFVGTPIGIDTYGATHNMRIQGNIFMDATDERNDTIDNPINCTTCSGVAVWNIALNNTLAEFNAGTNGNLVLMANLCSDTGEEDWPEPTNA